MPRIELKIAPIGQVSAYSLALLQPACTIDERCILEHQHSQPLNNQKVNVERFAGGWMTARLMTGVAFRQDRVTCCMRRAFARWSRVAGQARQAG